MSANGRRCTALVMALVFTMAASACTSRRASPAGARESAAAPTVTAVPCSGRTAGSLVRAFVADFNAGRTDLIRAYFARPPHGRERPPNFGHASVTLATPAVQGT